jgi:hypothetical protein
MKLKWLGALIGALLLAAAAPASATPVGVTVDSSTDVNNLGTFGPGGSLANIGTGAKGIDAAAFGSGKTYFDYIFSFTLTSAGQVTITPTATANSPFFDYHAAILSTAQVGNSLTDSGSDPINLVSGAGLKLDNDTNGGPLATLTLTAGTYYLRLFGLLPGSIAAGKTLTGIGGTFSVAATPIPAALPLFGTALGLMGFFGWRRKSTAVAVAA